MTFDRNYDRPSSMCSSCAERTKAGTQIHARFKRAREKRKPPRRPIPGSRCTPWKKHVNGTACRRPVDAKPHRPFVPPRTLPYTDADRVRL